MAKSSASQRKAAPRKSTPQQPVSQTNGKGPSGKSQPAGKSQSGKGYAKPAPKVRGTWLMVALVLATIDAVVGAVLPFVYRKQTTTVDMPILLASAVVVGLLGLVGVFLMWRWKRWGIYLYVLSILGSIGVGLVIFPSMAVAFHALIPLLVLGAALSVDKKLPLFD